MLNKIMLIGNLGRDPEMNYTQNGTALTRFSLAVTRSYKSSTGEKRDETEWFNIVAWDKLAEICNQYLRKGSKAYIEGRLTLRKYNDRNGVERYSLDVTASDMEMLTPKLAQSGSSSEFLAGSPDETDPLGDLEDHPF